MPVVEEEGVREEIAEAVADGRYAETATEPAPQEILIPKPRPFLSEDDLGEYFYGHSGQARLVAAIEYACKYARAQCPREEIIAAMAVRFGHGESAWPSDLAPKVFEFAAETIMRARLAARAEVRIAIYDAAFDTDVKPGQIGLLKAFAFEHLDWSREPIDAQMKKALREAEEEVAKGNMQ